MEEVPESLRKAFNKIIFAILFDTFLEYLAEEFNTSVFLIHIAYVKPSINDFREFVDKLRKLGNKSVSDSINGKILIVETFHEVFGFVHLGILSQD